MKKIKKPFYHRRIKILSVMIASFILLSCTAVLAFPGTGKGKAPTAMEKIGGMSAVSQAFVPMAIVQKMKDNKSWEKMDPEQQKFMEDLESEVNDIMKKNAEGVLTNEKLQEELKKLGTGLSAEQMQTFKDLVEANKKHAEFIEKYTDKGISKDDGMTYIGKALQENKTAIDAFRTGSKSGVLKIEIKASQAPSDIATHTIGERVPGIGQQPVRRTFMKDIFTIVNCSLEYIKYIDQETVVRDAKNTAVAGTTTHNTKLTWKERSIQITNVRDFIDVPVDMLADYDFVEGEIRKLIDTSVQLKIDNGLLTDDGAHPNLHSVDEVASEFDASNTLSGTIDPWSNEIQEPNIFDLIIAMSSQIVALGKDASFMPDTVIFNTIDRFKSLVIKDKNDQYILPPFVARVGGNEYNIEGMRVMSNPNVDPNSLYVLDSTKGTIYQRKTAVIEMSFENRSNFETETVTLKAYERLNLLIRNVDKNAFMKCSDIETALTSLKKA